jgi:3',5'-cyclic AMP phosphodiesterase CpdA
MRLAILSDIHGNLHALETALDDLRAAGSADTLWLLGDYALAGARPREAIQRMMALATEWGEGKIGFVRGNTDRYLINGHRTKSAPAENAEAFTAWLQGARRASDITLWTLDQLTYAEYEWLTKLRGELDVNTQGYGWVIGYHGTPGDDEGYLLPDTPVTTADDALLDREGRLGIGGHIHVQMDRILTTWRAINVGSVGMSFDKPGYAEYGIFTFEGDDVQVDLRAIPYDVEAAIADLYTSGYPHPDHAARRLREGNV